jgi:hypothetical protein
MGKLTKNGTALFVGVVALAAVAGIAQAETRFAVQDTTGTVDKMVVTDSGYIGIGSPAPAPGYPLQITGNTTNSSSILLSYGGNATYNRYADGEMRFARNNDAAKNNGFPVNGDRLGFFSFGTLASGVFKQSAGIIAEAQGDASATTTGGNLYLMTTAVGYTTAEQRVTVLSNGNVGVGTLTPAQKFEVNGGIRINTASAKPGCTSSIRGTLWFTQIATVGVADLTEVCAKDSSGAFTWKALY